jgi:hypothetical protein
MHHHNWPPGQTRYLGRRILGNDSQDRLIPGNLGKLYYADNKMATNNNIKKVMT